MERVWNDEFKHRFSHFFLGYHPQQMWFLRPAEVRPHGWWNTHVDSAKVRFSCQECGHYWTSMRGRVVFWFNLNPVTQEGLVLFRLYGQTCRMCEALGRYEDPIWYPEAVSRVMDNVFNRVGQVLYNFPIAVYSQDGRAGNARAPHRADLCHACEDGVCSQV